MQAVKINFLRTYDHQQLIFYFLISYISKDHFFISHFAFQKSGNPCVCWGNWHFQKNQKWKEKWSKVEEKVVFKMIKVEGKVVKSGKKSGQK